jgi:hypothetical protein
MPAVKILGPGLNGLGGLHGSLYNVTSTERIDIKNNQGRVRDAVELDRLVADNRFAVRRQSK